MTELEFTQLGLFDTEEYLLKYLNKKVRCKLDMENPALEECFKRGEFYKIVDVVMVADYIFVCFDNPHSMMSEMFIKYFEFYTIEDYRKDKIKNILND